MVLYLGSEKALPVIPYNPEQPAFNTKELDEHEKPVIQHFSKQHVIYVGSNEGCGCSFRHALYEKGEWSYVIPEEDEEAIATQVDHQTLVAYLKTSGLQKVEIYACWDGDYALSAEHHEEIAVEDILQPDFFFKERGHYRITIGN